MRPIAFLAAFAALATAPLRAADPVISEFMADNAGHTPDDDGQYMDWIEIYNPGPASVDLAGWALTDDAALPQKWVFPSRTVNAGEFVVVFASGKNRTGAQLHTNFSLNDAGEYLALVKPDGTTKTSEWNPYPPQKENVSWGTAQQVVSTPLVQASAGKVYVPGTAPDPAWNTAGFTPGGSWLNTAAPPGLGYDATNAPPAPANIAAAATLSQSTTNGAFTANLAVNGLTTDFTHTLGTDSAPFWNAAFSGDTTIHSITITNRTTCCQSRLRDITITILDAALVPVWTSPLLNPENTGFVAPAGPATLSVDLVALTGAPVVGRHVRVSRTPDPDNSGTGGTITTVDEQNVLSLAEVQIIGIAPAGLVNLARTGVPAPVATQSSNLNATYVAGLAINGVTGNSGDFTHTINTDLTPSWQVNLQRRTAISRVDLQNRVGCCPERLRDITVTILDTDAITVRHTSPLLNPANALSGPATLVYDVAANNGGNPVFGQYVKVSRTRDASGGSGADDAVVISLSEVLVMGTELNGYRPYIRSDIQTAMKDVSPTAYWRLPFTVADPAALTGLSLRLRYDDGFVAYLNGTEVMRRNAPASPDHTSTATTDRAFTDGLLAETVSLNGNLGGLLTGNNVLAFHGLNSAAGDDNFLIQPELTSTGISSTPNVYLESASPGALNNSPWYLAEVEDTVFSHRRGFYDAPFSLAITSTTAGAVIRYTLDNSEPTLTNGVTYTAPINIANPGGSYSGTRVVRARAFKPNWKSTNIDTHTYIFLDNVLSQTKGALSQAGAVSGTIPSGWPTSSATNGGQAYNFGFTAAVTAGYTTAQIREALTQIPSISVVTQQANLSDPVIGIYCNGTNGHGGSWERPASVEYLDFSKPGATPQEGHGQFSDNIGLRLRGGYSRNDQFVKHSFRLFWRNEYGNGKLNYRLYGPDGAGEFDTFDLRGSQNYAWSSSANDSQETLVRDPFSRELMGAMGQNWTRSKFAHVYLNGLYWGIFEIHERPENSYGQTYLGGDKDNYDVIKNQDRYSNGNFVTEATDGYFQTNPDGSRAAWKELWDRCKDVKNNPTNENYYRLLGCNPDGTRNPAYPVLLDVDNLITYTLALFYSGDGDACLSGFLSDLGSNANFGRANNWHGMRDRLGDRGFTFFNHDAEHTLRASSWAGSRGPAASDQTGPWPSALQNDFTYSNPQWLHQELMASPEYRLRYADHIRRHLFNNGALTPNQLVARWNARASTITKAIVPYAARYSTLASSITTWKNLCGIPGESTNGAGVIDNIPEDFLKMRTNLNDLTNPQNLLRQLTVDGLWPATTPADFSQHGGSVPGGYQLTVSVPGGLPPGAQIYYTLDGSDPRAISTGIPTPLTYASTSAATRYYVTTAAAGGDNGFTSTTLPQPSPGPISRYELNGNANDTGSASPANNGTLQNAPTFGTDRNGNPSSAIVLNGTNQAVTLGDPASLQITGQITIAAWVNPVTAATLRNIVNKGHNTTGVAPNPLNGEITLRVNTGANVNAGSWNGADHIATLVGGATVNTWQHFVSVYDGSAWRLYKNGVEVASTVDSTGAVIVAGSNATFNAWNIGSRGGSPGERAFHGSIDDVQIFNRGLTPQEVAALHNPAAVSISGDWQNPAYTVPASWGTATGGIGYDAKAVPTFTPYIATTVPQGASSTVLTRKDFTLSAAQIADTGHLQLNIRYDDGFIAYLNGTKIAERNAPAASVTSPSGTSAATAVRADASAIVQEQINITAFKNLLVDGNNVLAIQALNTTAGDNDLLLESEIVAADVATTNAATITPGAQLYTGALTLNDPVTVQTRVLHNGVWSALTSAFFSVATEAASASNIVISELHYNPADPVSPAELAISPDKDEYEFVEIMNINPTTSVDLTGVRFTFGVTSAALGNVGLLPGARGVFVKNVAAFNERYSGLSPAPRILGTYTGSFSNQGEGVILNANGGAAIKDFTYDDNAPWPTGPDNDAVSLVLIAPSTNPDHNLPSNWRSGTIVGGTPGTSSWGAWRAGNGNPDATSDDDSDGLNAIMEYVLGTSPAAANNDLPLAGTDGGFLTFSLTHRDRDDVVLTPEVSTDLNVWSSAGITLHARTPNPDGSVTTVWRAPVDVASSGRLFFQVQALLIP